MLKYDMNKMKNVPFSFINASRIAESMNDSLAKSASMVSLVG